jgi:anthranilate synthase component 2
MPGDAIQTLWDGVFLWEAAVATLLVIDNYDSFTYNLVQMFLPYPLDIRVVRSDRITVEAVEADLPDYVLVSPGPKDPEHAGISKALIRALFPKRPLLGVCLGLQCMNEVFGGKTVRSPLPMHGKTSSVHHDGSGLFAGLPSPFKAARYHSLMIEFETSELLVTARSADGVVMGVRHPLYPLHGVQFHPESFLTEHGHMIIRNFLNLGPVNVIGNDEAA